jgi:hypothetical protein
MAADNFLFYFASGLTTAANEPEQRGERNAIWQRTIMQAKPTVVPAAMG